MVSMDIIKRKKYQIVNRTICSIVFFLTCYFVFIRPLRVYVNKNYIAPFYLSFDQNQNTSVSSTDRRINILLEGYSSPRGFGIPFGGYFWLPLSLFIATRQKMASKILILYHLLLGIIPPYLAFLFVNNINWAGIGLKVNETLFQGVFLISLFLSLKTIFEIFKKDNKYS